MYVGSKKAGRLVMLLFRGGGGSLKKRQSFSDHYHRSCKK